MSKNNKPTSIQEDNNTNATPENKKSNAMEAVFLKTLREREENVSIYLVNGIRLIGKITAYDDFVIVLENPLVMKPQMVYKRQISTVVPE